MFGNNVQGAYIPQGTGFQYVGGAQAQPQKIYNVLTNEEIQKLITKENQFSLQLTATEVLRAKCNHRTADGMADAINNKDVLKSITNYLSSHDYGNESEVEKIYRLLSI